MVCRRMMSISRVSQVREQSMLSGNLFLSSWPRTFSAAWFSLEWHVYFSCDVCLHANFLQFSCASFDCFLVVPVELKPVQLLLHGKTSNHRELFFFWMFGPLP